MKIGRKDTNMTHIDPRLDKLVEASRDLVRTMDHKGLCHHQSLSLFATALKEASAPLKEFAGMTKGQWLACSELVEDPFKNKLLKAACRQIADGLEP